MKKLWKFRDLIYFLIAVFFMVGFWWYGKAMENKQIKEYAYIYLENVFLLKVEQRFSMDEICTAEGTVSYMKLFGIELLRASFQKLSKSKGKNDKENSYPDSRSRMKVVSISKEYNDAIVKVEVIMPPDNQKKNYKLKFKRDLESKIWKVDAISIFDFYSSDDLL